ncbi:MAG: hypothetical protein AB7G93_02645 [Bdellovibrionales bacterium]
MKFASLLLALPALIVAAGASASNGDPRGCYNMAIRIPVHNQGPITDRTDVTVPMDAFVCVKEKNMKQVGEIYAVGDIEISVYSRKTAEIIAVYYMNASASEGAAGTIYTTYGKSIEDLESGSSNSDETIVFGMHNGPVQKGDYAGHVDWLQGIGGIILIER